MIDAFVRIGFPLAVVLATGLLAAGAAPRLPREWEAGIKPGAANSAPMASLCVTSEIVLVQSANGESTVALHRGTGAELWRKAPGPQGIVERPPRDAWHLLGAGPAGRGGLGEAVAFLVRRRDSTGRGTAVLSSRIEVLHALTGRRLWEETLPVDSRGAPLAEPAAVAGEVLVLVEDHGDGARARFRELGTGGAIDPEGVSGSKILRRSADRFGSTHVPVGLHYHPYVVDLVTGSLRRVRVRNFDGDNYREPPDHLDYTAPEPLFAGGGRLFALLDMDDDGAGHSGWPKYLYSTDLQGQSPWRFPRRFTLAGEVAAPSSRIRQALSAEASGMVIARDAEDRLYGVRLQDGTAAWVKSLPRMRLIDVAATPNGFFVMAEPRPTGPDTARRSSLAWVDASRGRFRWLTGLPLASALTAEGEQLFVLAGDRVLALRAPKLVRSGP